MRLARLQQILIVLVIGLLGATIVLFGVSARFLSDGRYREALRLIPISSDAAVARASEAFEEKAYDESLRLTARALSNAPVNGDALGGLIAIYSATGRASEADRFVAPAAKLGWRNLSIQLLMLRKALEANDAESAILRTDALLEQEYDQDEMFPILRHASTTPEGFRTLVERLAAGPKWRRSFLKSFKGFEMEDYEERARLLHALGGTNAPPTVEESRALARALANRRQARATS